MLVWLGIVVCLTQSALFSGLNLGLFSISRLRLELEAQKGDLKAKRILNLRKDGNFLLATLIWGNVSVNVLLTILTDSTMTGVFAFIFSTFGITIFGEILPQAYFSKYTLRWGSYLIPLVRAYQWILYPLAKPSGLFLDQWLGKEVIKFFSEYDLSLLLQHHATSERTDVGHVESRGAINFLALDDVRIKEEGEVVDPKSIIALPIKDGLPEFPSFEKNPDDPFLQCIYSSERKWVILTDLKGEPQLVLDSNRFLRQSVYGEPNDNILYYCHRPILVTDPNEKLGPILKKFKVFPEHAYDDVIDHDLVLFWSDEKRIITGADILGRLMRGISRPIVL